MFGSVMLDVVMAMAFLYLIMSLACTSLNELIASALGLRARVLAAGVRSLLGSEAQRDKLFNHALIRSLARDSTKKINPSYIPSRTFALALLDQLAREAGKAEKAVPGPGGPVSDPSPDAVQRKPPSSPITQIEQGLRATNSTELTESLTILIREAGEDLKALQTGVERWFNDTMDRAGGWYKRRVQTILLVLAVALTVGLNADTVMIGNALIRDATLRATVIAAAEQYTRRPAADGAGTAVPSIDTLRSQLTELQLPIGWSYEMSGPTVPRGLTWWLTKILGLAITAVAVSLGAPFWFDVLSKVSKLRGSGTKPPQRDETVAAGGT